MAFQVIKFKSVLNFNTLLEYLGGESNPYLKIRNFPFYPLNYQGVVMIGRAKLQLLIGFCKINLTIAIQPYQNH